MPSTSTTNTTQVLSPLKKLKGHTRHVCSLAFFSDSDRAISGSNDRSARIWDIPRAKGIGKPLLGHRDWVNCVAVSPDDAWVVTGDADGKLRIWNVSTKRLVGRPWDAHGGSAVTCVAWSPDGRCIASGSSDEASLKIWDGSSAGVLMRSMRSGNSQAGGWLCVAYSPDGSKLAAGGNVSGDGASISIWNTENGSLAVPPIRGHDDGVCSLSWSADEKYLSSGSKDGILRFWEMERGHSAEEPLDLQVEKTHSIALSASHNLVAVASDGDIHLWDLGKRRRRTYTLDGSEAYRVVFSPNGDYLASYGHSRDITIWDMKSVVQEYREAVKQNFLDTAAPSIPMAQVEMKSSKLPGGRNEFFRDFATPHLLPGAQGISTNATPTPRQSRSRFLRWMPLQPKRENGNMQNYELPSRGPRSGTHYFGGAVLVAAARAKSVLVVSKREGKREPTTGGAQSSRQTSGTGQQPGGQSSQAHRPAVSHDDDGSSDLVDVNAGDSGDSMGGKPWCFCFR